MVQYTITTRVDGDVLKVFWSYRSEVGFVKVPRNNKRCLWVRGFLLAYIPIQFLECLVCVGLRGEGGLLQIKHYFTKMLQRNHVFCCIKALIRIKPYIKI